MKRLLFLCSLIALSCAQCPWDDSSLIPWSSSSGGWTTPGENGDVVIDNIKIILDVQPPRLNSITIQNGGQLVWGNVDNIELKARFILVGANGRFDIGSESCQFSKKATITLWGKDGEGVSHPVFGRKYLGVDFDGTLEFHSTGPTPSWTQLEGSVSSNAYFNQYGGRGFNLARINPLTGDFIEAGHYDTFDGTGTNDMINYLNALPQGAMVLFAAMDSATWGQLNETLKAAMEGFGASRLGELASRDSYALIGIKGAAQGTVPEVYQKSNTTAAVINKNFTEGEVAPGSAAYNVYILSAGWLEGSKIVISVQTNLNPILTFKESVNWPVGSKIVLSSTDYSYQQYEEAVTIPCPSCQSNQVRISAPVKYLHFGEIVHGVDMRGEVAVLDRQITVQGEMESSCYQTSPSYLCTLLPYDTFGGHFKVVSGFKNVHVENVEFYHMGQQIIGNYPVHFHMCGDVDEVGGYTDRTYIKGASIHHSFSRCVTIHATNGLWVKDTVGYDHLGHCFFLEDGIEIRNVLEHNLGLVTRPSTILPTDRDSDMCSTITPTDFNGKATDVNECNAISTFWIENPNNDLIGNVAAGSIQMGFWYIFPSRPTGPSEQAGIDQNVYPQNTPLGKFINNTGHSNGRNGLFFDDGIKGSHPSADQPGQFLARTGMRYRPRAVPSDMGSPRVPAVLENFTAYKNRDRGVWVRGGDFRFINYFSSDNPIGMTLASEGTYPNDPGSSQTLVGGVFIGESHNNGTAGFDDFYNGRTWGNWRGFPLRGFEFYDGPVSIKDVKFYNFNNNGYNNASAIGWLLTNKWQLSPASNLSKVSFYNVENRVHNIRYSNYDGDFNSVFHDIDGSCSGVRNSSVVTNSPFFNTYRCTERPTWNTQTCHEKMGNFFINNMDAGNTNYAGNAPGIIFVRDDRSDYTHNMVGIPGGTQFQPVVIHNKTYTIHWPHASPPFVRISLVNFDIGMWTRVGFCFPADPSLQFTVTKGNGSYIYEGTQALTQVNSLAEVDADNSGNSYYFDSDTGLLFVRLVASVSRVGDNYCPPLGCESVLIRATGGSIGSNSGTCAAYPKYAVQEYVPADPGCIGELDGCGVCNGDESTCCVQDCSAIDENMVCSIPNCVCKSGYELVSGKCEVSRITGGGNANRDEVNSGNLIKISIFSVVLAVLFVL